MLREPGLQGVSFRDRAGLCSDSSLPESKRTSSAHTAAAWLLKVLQLKVKGQRGCHGQRTPLLLPGAADSHLCALLPTACYLPVHPRGSSVTEPGSQGSSFPLELLWACEKLCEDG